MAAGVGAALPAAAAGACDEAAFGGIAPVQRSSVVVIGQRVRVAGNLATICWGPGPLQAPPPKKAQDSATGGAEGQPAALAPPDTVEVVGIEYDEPGLGKHDGCHQGQRLFSCEQGQGSFVKVEKVQTGVPIQRALTEKYFAAALPNAATKGQVKEEVDAMEFTDSKGREKTMAVEFVGRYGIEQRQQRLEGFVEIALAEVNVECRYPDDVWEGDWSLPNLRSLWLDKTLIHHWGDVVTICELCPQLEWLSLARTRMASLVPGVPIPPPEGVPLLQTGFDNRLVLQPFVCRVKTLVLSSTSITWDSLLALSTADVFPCLENLHLPQNHLQEGIPQLESSPFPHLRSLILDDNGISDWRVLQRAISTFPKLEALHLNKNMLGKTLEGLAEVSADKTPRRLTALFLSENRMASWQAIGALSGYAVLELKAQRIPLTEGASPLASPMLLRQVFIALMPTLLRLNASEVTTKERTAAERYFLGLALQGDSRMVRELRETCDLDPHVVRLKGIHGEVVGGEVTEEAQATRTALQQSLVEVSLRPVGAAIVDQPMATKRVPHTMTVGEMKRLGCSLFKKVPLERVRLELVEPGLPFGIALDDEARELGFYGVGDGTEIRVDDVADRVPARAAAGRGK